MSEEYEKISDEGHYDRHLASIYEKLENKEYVPWHKPWKTGQDAVANIASGRKYTGLSNIMVLNMAGYDSRWWITENKIKEFKGKLLEGEEDKFVYVFYWHRHKYAHTDERTGEIRSGMKFYPRTHKVWNIDQTEGVIHHRMVPDEEFEHEEIPEFVDIVENYCSGKGPKLAYRGDRAYYSPMDDSIQVPRKEVFEQYEMHVSTVFHELGHSTGHKSRLNRRDFENAARASVAEYAKEELIAELTATILMSTIKFSEQQIVSATDNSVSYMQNWAKVIKDDPKAFVVAGRQAEKASDFILAASDRI